ncbi:hypothetical protein STENM223S_08818 [Streptomyces tendae]
MRPARPVRAVSRLRPGPGRGDACRRCAAAAPAAPVRRDAHRGNPTAGICVTLGDGPGVRADRVVLTTGHPLPELRPEQVELASFARGAARAAVRAGDSAVDMPLDGIAPGRTVGVIGLELSLTTWSPRSPPDAAAGWCRRRTAGCATSPAAANHAWSPGRAAGCRCSPVAATRRGPGTPTGRGCSRGSGSARCAATGGSTSAPTCCPGCWPRWNWCAARRPCSGPTDRTSPSGSRTRRRRRSGRPVPTERSGRCTAPRPRCGLRGVGPVDLPRPGPCPARLPHHPAGPGDGRAGGRGG